MKNNEKILTTRFIKLQKLKNRTLSKVKVKIKSESVSHRVQFNKNVEEVLSQKQRQHDSIFSKRKRESYMGYKQYNLNKSRYINLEQETGLNRQPPVRKYEINIKNIAKLRKRYSLEPSRVKTLSAESSFQKGEIFKVLTQSRQIQIDASERNHQNGIRQMMKQLIGKNQKNEYFEKKEEKQICDKEIQGTNHTNIPEDFQRYQKAVIAVQTGDNKLYLDFCSSPLKNPIQSKTKVTSFRSKKTVKKEENKEGQLCGWETQAIDGCASFAQLAI